VVNFAVRSLASTVSAVSGLQFVSDLLFRLYLICTVYVQLLLHIS